MYLLEDKHSQAAIKWCFIQKVLWKFFWKFTRTQLCWSLKLQAWDLPFFKKNTPPRCFSVNFGKFSRPLFLQNISGSCFWIILFTCPYNETQIKSRVLPFRKYNTVNLKVKTYSCWMTTFDYFRLQMLWFF